MNWLLFVGGIAMMLGAVASDPWGRSHSAAALYLVGAAMFVIAVLGAS